MAMQLQKVENVRNVMSQELSAQQAGKKSEKGPLFLWLAENQVALIRPLVNIDQVIVCDKHSVWSQRSEERINAICARSVGSACSLCQQAQSADDKKLYAKTTFYVPVYVYGVKENGIALTYQEKQENGETVEKPVKGFRLLEVSRYGVSRTILNSFWSVANDSDYGNNIATCDFMIQQNGSGQQKSYTVTPKPPKAIDPRITQNFPGLEHFSNLLIEALPPQVAGDTVSYSSTPKTEDDDDFPF